MEKLYSECKKSYHSLNLAMTKKKNFFLTYLTQNIILHKVSFNFNLPIIELKKGLQI